MQSHQEITQSYADTPFFDVPSAKLYEATKFEGAPRYDARYVRRYARNIMAHANYFAELDAELGAEMRGDGFRQDAGLSLAFARSLEYIIRKPYEAEYAELRATEFIPVMTEIPPEAASFTYRMIDKSGNAAIINDNGSDAPKVDIHGKERQAPVVTIGASYDYTILDSMRAARMGIPLEAYKAESCRWACELLNEQLAAYGNAASGIVGIANAPGILATTQVSSGNWMTQVDSIGSATTSNATPPAVVVAQAIVADFLAMKKNIFVATNGLHEATDALIPVAAYAALAGTPRSPGYTNDTLLDYIETLTGLNINCWPQLNSAGGTTTTWSGGNYKGRVVVYKKDPKILSMMIAQPFVQIPPQANRLAWEVIGYMRVGGTQVRFPKAVAYMDGVA
jgi:hypothetical protein